MDLSPFKQDIDELIDEFAQGESTTLTEMKRVWLSRKFSFIFEASPSSNLGFFMQSLYGHSIVFKVLELPFESVGDLPLPRPLLLSLYDLTLCLLTLGHMVNGASLSERLGGLYCLYCLYETQPFRPPYLIYVSLGELTKLRELVVDAKAKGIKVVCALVRRMLEKNMFLLGAVEFNECSVKERINELTDLQNARVGVAYKKLLANTRIEHFLHMDLGAESDVEMLKKMSTDYAKAKELAIKEASEVVDVENVKHLSENKNLIGDVVEKIAEDWTIQKQAFYQKTGFKPPSAQENHEQECDTLGMELALSNHLVIEQEKENDEFDRELELILSNQHQDEENEDQK
ncbi:snRNA-activating protein complex subunit 1 [Dillenia turbinata]|uniref:snRNA-activating protein complex subunit 1 n=1 Tax=Dillenia turbinata TaxID=194707 RepID=A0AAN8W4S6_9MAGN